MPFLVFSQGYGKFPWLYKYDVKTVVEKLGFFSDHISQKHHAFIMISVDIKKKPTMSFAWQDLQKIQLNTVYVCNLVNAFWNNNKRNMERKKIANMNKEKAYTRNTYVAHYTQMQHLCIQSYNKCICTDDNITIWVYTLIKLFCHLNWLAITKYIKYGW